jgi:hypothetical protein
VADLSKLVNELSNLTVLQSSELATMLAEKWRVQRDPSARARKAPSPNEHADLKLMEELIFGPNNVLLEPFSKEEMAKGKTPDFRLMKESTLRGYCELKSPRDDWVFELPADIKPGEVVSTTRRDPTSNNLARQVQSAAEQFDAVNPDHKLPNVLAIVNHAAGRSRSDLHIALTGIQVPDGPRLFTMKPAKQAKVWDAARRIDLFLWIDPQKRSWQHVYPDDAVHRAMACDLLGIEISEAKAE